MTWRTDKITRTFRSRDSLDEIVAIDTNKYLEQQNRLDIFVHNKKKNEIVIIETWTTN